MKHISIIHSTLDDLSLHFVIEINIYAIKDVVAIEYSQIVQNYIKILKIFIFAIILFPGETIYNYEDSQNIPIEMNR